jgi:syntaxin 16
MLSVNDDINHDGYSDIEMNTLGRDNKNAGELKKPDWVADVEIVEKCISDITQQMKELQSRHAQRIGSVFGRDLQNMETVIEQQTSIITEQFRVAERLLQKVGYATKRSGGQEATVGANVQRR